MSSKNKKKRNKEEKMIKLNFETNQDTNNNEDAQMATTISSYKNFNQNKTNRLKTENKQFHLTFNKTLKSHLLKEKSKKFSNTINGL